MIVSGGFPVTVPGPNDPGIPGSGDGAAEAFGALLAMLLPGPQATPLPEARGGEAWSEAAGGDDAAETVMAAQEEEAVTETGEREEPETMEAVIAAPVGATGGYREVGAAAAAAVAASASGMPAEAAAVDANPPIDRPARESGRHGTGHAATGSEDPYRTISPDSTPAASVVVDGGTGDAVIRALREAVAAVTGSAAPVAADGGQVAAPVTMPATRAGDSADAILEPAATAEPADLMPASREVPKRIEAAQAALELGRSVQAIIADAEVVRIAVAADGRPAGDQAADLPPQVDADVRPPVEIDAAPDLPATETVEASMAGGFRREAPDRDQERSESGQPARPAVREPAAAERGMTFGQQFVESNGNVVRTPTGDDIGTGGTRAGTELRQPSSEPPAPASHATVRMAVGDGEARVRVAVRGDSVTATVTVEAGHAAALASRVEDLRQGLRDQGFSEAKVIIRSVDQPAEIAASQRVQVAPEDGRPRMPEARNDRDAGTGHREDAGHGRHAQERERQQRRSHREEEKR